MAAGVPEVFFSEVMNDTESSINANVDTSLTTADSGVKVIQKEKEEITHE